MDGDESMLSFFDEQDFDFARDERSQLEGGEKATKVNVILFSDQITEDGEVAGMISIRVVKSLKAGSFFLRLDTIEELKLTQPEKNEPLSMLLHRLRPERPSFNQLLVRSRKDIDDEKGQLMSNPITARDLTTPRVQPKGEINLSRIGKKLATIVPSTSRRVKDIGCSVYYLAPERNIQATTSTTIEKLIFDIEIFTLDSEILNNPILIIPFRFELKAHLVKTCSISLDMKTYVALSKDKKKAARIITERILESSSEPKSSERPKVIKSPVTNRNTVIGQGQQISLKHLVTCYFAPKTELLVYNKQPGEESNKAAQRKKHFQDITSSLWGTRELLIFPNFRSLDYKTHERKGQAYLVQEHPYFLCCSKKLNLEVNICVDLINLRNQDTTLNFVMQLNKQILNDFPFLDVVIYSRLTRRHPDSEHFGASSITNFVNLVDSFDLIEKLPPSYNEKTIEFVRELNVSPLVGRQQTVDSFQVKIEFFIGFYLSSVAQRFEQELMKIPLSFWKVGKDAKFLDKQANNLKFNKLEKFVDGYNKEELSRKAQNIKTPCIILPYAVFDLATDIDKETGMIRAEQLGDQEID
jgi:hypothetical protein